MQTLFSDADHGGYFRTASDAEILISRPKEIHDGVMPSGNSCAAMVLQQLSELTAEKRWMEAAEAQNMFIAGRAERFGSGISYGLLAMMRALYPHRELICCGESDGGSLEDYLSRRPANALSILWKTAENAERLEKFAPFTQPYQMPEQGTLWYLCTNGACALPENSFDALHLT